MKKLALLFAIVLSLSACSDNIEVKTKDSYGTVCIDGVTYVAFKEVSSFNNKGYGFLSVKLDTESKIIECR